MLRSGFMAHICKLYLWQFGYERDFLINHHIYFLVILVYVHCTLYIVLIFMSIVNSSELYDLSVIHHEKNHVLGVRPPQLFSPQKK